MLSNKKITCIFLLIFFSYSLIVFNGIIDDFSPLHVTVIERLSERSYLDQNDYTTNDMPGFYILGVAIKLISNISSMGFLTYPLQLLPYLIVFYVFILKLSNSPFLSYAATFLVVCAGSTGTDNVFFWPHGVGSIVYYVILFLIFSIISSPGNKKSEFCLLLIICGCSLAFLSYDVYAILIVFLLFFMLVTWFFGKEYIKSNFINSKFINSKSFLNFYLILLITQFGLCKFTYNTFIPSFMASSNQKISVVDKFLSSYFYTKPRPEVSMISELLINYPRIITVISLLKYLIICLSVILFISLFIKKMRKNTELSVFDIFLFSYLMYSCTYFLIRTYFGGIAITAIFMPGIFCIIWLYQFSIKYKNWAKFAIIMLLILTPTYTYLIEINHFRNQSVHDSEYLMASSSWYFEHKGDIIGVSDEMSKDLMSMFIFEKFHQSSGIRILPVEDAGFLVNKLNSKKSVQYYLVNYKLRRMSLQNWIIIKNWSIFENSIDSNKHICKIYDLDSISIYV